MGQEGEKSAFEMGSEKTRLTVGTRPSAKRRMRRTVKKETSKGAEI